jgi:hypothetical protein
MLPAGTAEVQVSVCSVSATITPHGVVPS